MSFLSMFKKSKTGGNAGLHPPYVKGNIAHRSEYERELLRRAGFGDIEAMENLVMGYWHAIGDIELDKDAALYWKKVIVDKAVDGNLLAMGTIGKTHALYMTGSEPLDTWALLFDRNTSKKCYDIVLSSAESGNAEAMIAVYRSFHTNTEGMKYLLRSARLGHEDAYYFLMYAYYMTANPHSAYNYGIDRNSGADLTAEMVKWGTAGAESSSIYSDKCQFTLALHYFDLRDTSLDIFDEKKINFVHDSRDPNVMRYQTYMKMAAKSGNLEAIRRLE